MNKSYVYKNEIWERTVIPIPPVTMADILYLTREGIGVRLESEFSTGTVTCDVWRFSLRFKKDGQTNTGELFKVAEYGNKVRSYKLQGSDPTQPGIIYNFTIFGERCDYEVQTGDSETDILENLASVINATDFSSFPTASASVVGDILTITTNIPYNVTTDVIAGDNYIFKTGHYAVLNVLEISILLLIDLNESNINFPNFDTIAASYSYQSLTVITGNIKEYLSEDGYTIPPFPLPTIFKYSTANITDAPFLPSNSSRAVLDEANNRIIFSPSSPIRNKEVINLLYK